MTTTTTKKLTHAEKVDLYDKLIRTNSNLERKGDTIPYTSLNGNMFTYQGERENPHRLRVG